MSETDEGWITAIGWRGSVYLRWQPHPNEPIQSMRLSSDDAMDLIRDLAMALKEAAV